MSALLFIDVFPYIMTETLWVNFFDEDFKKVNDRKILFSINRL